MKRNLLLLTLLVVGFSPVFSQALYTSTVQTGNRFNPGLGVSGTPMLVFDDVLIPSAQVQSTDSISITNVKFGIRRLANAQAVTINFYYTVVDDTATMYDYFIKIPPVLIGTIDLPLNGANAVTNLVSLGDSVNALFKVKTDTGNLYTGYQTLFLGLSITGDDPDALNGWRITTPGAPSGDNDDAIWIYDVDDPAPRFATYFQGNPPATMYLEVYGKALTTVPVTLTEFNARRSGKINQLNWTTQQELNSSYFVVERSTNGRNFENVGKVAATGNSNNVHQYNFTDNNPVRGINYYRLRTIDKDNSSKLSATRSIRNAGIADVSFYPNPATVKMNVAFNTERATQGHLSIMDGSGRLVYSRPVKLPQGNTLLPIQVNNLATGNYIMKIQLDDDVILKKFSKQ